MTPVKIMRNFPERYVVMKEPTTIPGTPPMTLYKAILKFTSCSLLYANDAMVAVNNVNGRGVPSATYGGRLRNSLNNGVSMLLPPIPKNADMNPVRHPIIAALRNMFLPLQFLIY
jgi:hypothetical protein